ncbi:hypothetical protein RHSIM_Rhsim01G0065000 [Rhododendron simsii]|uniref:Uncharacterized protein n=1 Tax=Rhododendron simsii TaxID=118357 RepID=A0A834LYB1_RHOSS|nr:hypothetical protein RHSIM_Rhsim01G0065000 [Rhododendron simsii]
MDIVSVSGGIFEKEVCILSFSTKCLPIRHVMVTNDDIGNVWDDGGCGKNDIMTIVERFKPPIYDECPEEDVVSKELKLLTARNVPQFHPSNPTVNSNKQKVDDWDWLDESVVKQHTKIFETYGVIRGSECSFVMDSGSTGNYVSENLVSFLNLPTEDLASPYHVRWVNHEARTLVTKRCLVEFSIGHQYEDKIWCDVVRCDGNGLMSYFVGATVAMGAQCLLSWARERV